MKSYQYIKRSLLYYWRSHLAVLVASAMGTTILVGSLIVGDSVRYSMQQITLLSLGNVEYAVETGDRYFQTALGDNVGDELKTAVSSVLHVQGVVSAKGGRPPVGQVQVYGVRSSFERCWLQAMPISTLQPDEAIINSKLAARVGKSEGDEILVRVENANLMPHDTPLVSDNQSVVTLRLKVKAIVDARSGADFSLRTNQVAPYNLFVSHGTLSKRLNIADQTVILWGLAKNVGDTITYLDEAGIIRSMCISINWYVQNAFLRQNSHGFTNST